MLHFNKEIFNIVWSIECKSSHTRISRTGKINHMRVHAGWILIFNCSAPSSRWRIGCILYSHQLIKITHFTWRLFMGMPRSRGKRVFQSLFSPCRSSHRRLLAPFYCSLCFTSRKWKRASFAQKSTHTHTTYFHVAVNSFNLKNLIQNKWWL